MKENYSHLILPKDFILYYTSDNQFISKSNFLSCLFHPSENELDYVTKLKLKKDISLFFAIDFKISDRDQSLSIPVCLIKELTKTYFFKENIKNVKDFNEFMDVHILKKYNFNGFINMQILYDGQLEIHLINNFDIYDFETEPINKDWKREGFSYTKGVIQKIWGSNYPIYFNKNVILIINDKYKYFIELFLQNLKNKKYKFNKSLQILLRDCEIKYYNNN
jgi:hypothetical protein